MPLVTLDDRTADGQTDAQPIRFGRVERLKQLSMLRGSKPTPESRASSLTLSVPRISVWTRSVLGRPSMPAIALAAFSARFDTIVCFIFAFLRNWRMQRSFGSASWSGHRGKGRNRHAAPMAGLANTIVQLIRLCAPALLNRHYS